MYLIFKGSQADTQFHTSKDETKQLNNIKRKQLWDSDKKQNDTRHFALKSQKGRCPHITQGKLERKSQWSFSKFLESSKATTVSRFSMNPSTQLCLIHRNNQIRVRLLSHVFIKTVFVLLSKKKTILSKKSFLYIFGLLCQMILLENPASNPVWESTT